MQQCYICMLQFEIRSNMTYKAVVLPNLSSFNVTSEH